MINGLTKLSHPCQVMADVMTFEEKKGPIRGRTVAWVGDVQQCLRLLGSCRGALRLHAEGRHARVARAASRPCANGPRARGAKVTLHRPIRKRRSKGADCVVTDTWVSMGDKEANRRRTLLKPYQVNRALMAQAAQAMRSSCIASPPIAARRSPTR